MKLYKAILNNRIALWSVICGGFALLVVAAVLAWSATRFTRVSICTSCHIIFVDYDEYKPVWPLSESVEDYKPTAEYDPGLFNVTVGCAECHAYPYDEYRDSAHYENDQGVKAGCVGCHNVHSVRQILLWKFFYVNKGVIGESPFHAISNSLRDIPEWNELRIKLAGKVRKQMIEEKGAKCKTCHKTESKWYNKIKRHQEAENKTCIQCHYNLVHHDVKWTEGKK